MAGLTGFSDSVVASLCREMFGLRIRSQLVIVELRRCKQERLVKRLRRELHQLVQRQQEIRQAANELTTVQVVDPMGIEFLKELTRRPLSNR